jgi:hypothetical protein
MVKSPDARSLLVTLVGLKNKLIGWARMSKDDKLGVELFTKFYMFLA